MASFSTFANTPPEAGSLVWRPMRSVNVKAADITFVGSVVRVVTPESLGAASLQPTTPPAGWVRSDAEDGRTVEFTKTTDTASYGELYQLLELSTGGVDAGQYVATATVGNNVPYTIDVTNTVIGSGLVNPAVFAN